MECRLSFMDRAVVLAHHNSKKKQRFDCAALIGCLMTLHESERLSYQKQPGLNVSWVPSLLNT